MFLPTTAKEMTALGWKQFDIILVCGDTYIDSPSIGTAVIGNILTDAGYKVGVIAQPDMDSDDIARLGEPRLFWGVSGGSVDSMVANYTAIGRKRKSDDFTPGGRNDRRPDRAVIAYSNLIRRHFKKTVPIVLGGIEASLRRIAHYDFWSNRIRRSILLDAKADYLLYGMADRSVLELASALANGLPSDDISGLCRMTADISPQPGDIILPSYEEVAGNPDAFSKMFHLFYRHNNPFSKARLLQRYDRRYLVHNPPARPLTIQEMDRVYGLPYQRDAHPFYAQQGVIKALETIRFSLTTHRGCYGECNFCAIAVHQGRIVQDRSEESIVREATAMTEHPLFKGVILDVGGATANMYGIECRLKQRRGPCQDKRCLFPDICKKLPVNHLKQRSLLARLRGIKKVRHVFVASGLRYDMVLADRKEGEGYLRDLLRHHVSGQLKVAPEHSEEKVLVLMGKPGGDLLPRFRGLFNRICAEEGKKQFLTYYFIAAYPGCSDADMAHLHTFVKNNLQMHPEQIQIFTPTPSTFATLMYHTGKDLEGRQIAVVRDVKGKERQKNMMLTRKRPVSRGGRK